MAAPRPDRIYVERDQQFDPVRPSWSANPGYLDEGHRTVFDETKDIPGWQADGDSYKLYEMAHFAGDVILEIGVYGGRSAVVELKGALSNPARTRAPQFYGLDLDPEALRRGHASLTAFGLAPHALLFQGTTRDFVQAFDIRPTMVFVDADHRYEGVKQDLETLSRILAPGVPVLCHDYCNKENDNGEYGVRQAVDEWERSGHATFLGAFGCSALLLTTERCQGTGRDRSPDEFAAERQRLLGAYGIA